MNVTGSINKFLESRATAGTIFAVTGLSKLASDYKNAPDDKKNFTLAHDSIVLGASAVGVFSYNTLSKKLAKNKTIAKTIIKGQNKILSLLKNEKTSTKAKNLYRTLIKIGEKCTDNTLMLGTGILGAVGADYAMHATRLDKKFQKKKIYTSETRSMNRIYDTSNNLVNRFNHSELNKRLENTVGTEVTSNMYNRMFDFPAMRMFSTSMVGMQGFEVIEEKTLKSKMKHATKCLIANSVVPIFFLSTATALTKKMNNIVRLPLTFATMIFGTMYTNKYLDKHQYKYLATNNNNKN